ncbi:MAG: DUF853 family protein [Betaproteobacteria bacterium]|nr:DUF853 family protein [Betaproteobacteria bacterium]
MKKLDMKILIIGGGGAGKTVALKIIAESLRKSGMEVLCEDGGVKINPTTRNLDSIGAARSLESRTVLIATKDEVLP